MTFLELAEIVLKETQRPLTANEIWHYAVENGFHERLKSSGKTPSATLGARLYVVARDTPESGFRVIGQRPKRFYLSELKYGKVLSEIDFGENYLEDEGSKLQYLEKDLHPFLAHFAYYRLSCFTKTINHSRSGKKEYGEWVHPDMVGCVFPIGQWDDEVLQLSSSVGNTSIKFISFELKKDLTLSTLREKFFQTVSNSSWANESYIVSERKLSFS